MKISLSTVEKRFLKHLYSDDEIEGFIVQPSLSELQTADVPIESPFNQGYVTNQSGVARDMLAFLDKFYANFPEKRNADLFLASESYGGHRLY